MNVKQKKKIITVIMIVAVLTCIASCVTTTSSSEVISARAELTADDYRIVDWKDRSIGEIASPAWLLPAVRGNWTSFKREWPVDSDKVLKIGVARHARLNGAQTIAEVQYAARLGSQLRQSVLSRAAITLGSDGEFDLVNNAATQVNVSIAGQERLTDFWQLVETTGENGKKVRTYQFWVVYASNSSVWDQIVAKYIFDVVGKLPDTKAQQTIAGMFNDINAEIKYEREKTQAQFDAEIAARQQALRQPMSASEVRNAFQSNDPAVRAAAGTTKTDTDYVASLAVLAGSR